MPNLDDMVPTKSRFLTKEEVGEQGKNLTIRAFSQAELDKDGQKESRYVIEWIEDFKPMVLNKENASRLKMIFKTSDSDALIGKMVNVYNDPFVSFGGEIKGGIRLRPPAHAAAQAQMAPRQQPAPQPQQRKPAPDSYLEYQNMDKDGSIPF
jgi:hypothetical protein